MIWLLPREWTLALCLALGPLLGQAQSQSVATDKPADASEPDSTSAHRWSAAWGGGVFLYKEPDVMQLSGPEVMLQLRYRPDAAYWPERLQADLGVALLRYTSTQSGNMDAVPALTGRGLALWRLHKSEDAAIWRAGLALDMVWTDLRGTSSTGNHGYRRLGSKAWAVLERESVDGARTQIGALLQGRQDSLLSDMGSRDISNTQRNGLYLAYQHHAIGEMALRPWLRYSQIGKSAYDGPYFEPRNRTLQVGVLIAW